MSRFTIEFSEEVDRQIDEIAKALHVPTKAEVVRKALGLLSYTIKEQQTGSKLVFENERKNIKKEVVTL